MRILSSAPTEFQVELTLKPDTAITEQFILQLESALGQRVGSLSLFRVRRHVLLFRFAVERIADDDSTAERIQEVPSPYIDTRPPIQRASQEMPPARWFSVNEFQDEDDCERRTVNREPGN
jgi:hypothetical protein